MYVCMYVYIPELVLKHRNTQTLVNTALSCNFPLKSIHRIYCNYKYSSTINPIVDLLSTTFPWHGGGQNANPLPYPRYGRAVLRGNLSGIEQNHYKAITKITVC